MRSPGCASIPVRPPKPQDRGCISANCERWRRAQRQWEEGSRECGRVGRSLARNSPSSSDVVDLSPGAGCLGRRCWSCKDSETVCRGCTGCCQQIHQGLHRRRAIASIFAGQPSNSIQKIDASAENGIVPLRGLGQDVLIHIKEAFLSWRPMSASLLFFKQRHLFLADAVQ